MACLEGIEDRDSASDLLGWTITIDRNQLPKANPDEFYWADLIGMRVFSETKVDFGVVDHLLETGANDVLVVKGEKERLIPFIQGQSIIKVDLVQRVIEVDWDPDF